MIRIFITLFASLIAQASLFAQPDISLPFMDAVWQSNRSNPAAVSDSSRLIIGSNTYGGLYNSIRNFITYSESEGSTVILDANKIAASVLPENRISPTIEIETIGIQYRLNPKMYLSFHHALKLSSNVEYPGALIKLRYEGNAQYIGEEVNIGPDFDLNAYQEFALGYAYSLGKLGLGVRVKYLSGIGTIQTEKSGASLFTDDDIYQLTIKTDYEINTASFLEFEDNFNVNFDDFGLGKLFTKNTGYGLDLGLTFEASQRLKLGLSITDIGSITWSENARNYSSQIDTTYSGEYIDITSIIAGDTISFDGEVNDLTFQSVFNIQETTNSFSTNLAKKAYLTIGYQLSDDIRLGALLFLKQNKKDWESIIALNAQKSFFKEKLILGVNYSYREENSNDNLGINGILKLGPVQVFALTDNILAPFLNSTNFNFRVGFNLIFGQNKLTTPERKNDNFETE